MLYDSLVEVWLQKDAENRGNSREGREIRKDM
jgi:hypothetical protein